MLVERKSKCVEMTDRLGLRTREKTKASSWSGTAPPGQMEQSYTQESARASTSDGMSDGKTGGETSARKTTGRR